MDSSLTSTTTDSFNRLWLLFLIPIVLAAVAILVLVWWVLRRRRRQRARRSALRNVTLLVHDEEKAREREEKRLSRRDSVRSVLGRRNTLEDKRQRRYDKRISRAIDEERRAAQEEESHAALLSQEEGSVSQQQPSAASPAPADKSRTITFAETTTAAAAIAAPISRKASVKHRDREVAQRVWRIPGEEMEQDGNRHLARDLAAASAALQEHEAKAAAAEQAYTTDQDSQSSHQRPSQRRRRAAELSMIRESGLSEAAASNRASRDRFGGSNQASNPPQAADEVSPATLISARDLHDDPKSMDQDAPGTSPTEFATADEASSQLVGPRNTGTAAQDDPFSSPVSPEAHEQAGGDPFVSPTASVHGEQQRIAGPASATQRPIAAVLPDIITTSATADSLATAPREPSGLAGEASSPSRKRPASPILSRKLSEVIRLGKPSPTKGRSGSPATAKNAPHLTSPVASQGQSAVGPRRSSSSASTASQRARGGKSKWTGSSTATDQPEQDFHALKRTASSPRQARSFFRIKGSVEAPIQQSQPLNAALENWAYTSRAAEWKTSSVPEIIPSHGGPPTISPRSSSAEPRAARLDSRLAVGSRGEDSTTNPSSTSLAGPGEGTRAQDKDGVVQRKPSIGVAGSRFKETFE